MKRARAIVMSIILASMLLALSLPAYAIGFEAEKVYESVFVVYTDNSIGSGFAMGMNCIVTNAHVVEDAESIVLTSYEGNEYEARVYLIDDTLDIALLVTSNTNFEALPIADFESAKIGDDIYTIGAPNSMTYTLTKGVISAKERIIRRQSYIQIDAAINAGNSGGPLLNDFGEVLGINTLKMSDSEGIGLSIPMTTVRDFLTESGIELDDDFHVAGDLTVQKIAEETISNSDTENNDNAEGSKNNPMLMVALCISILLNITFTIVLLHKKKKAKMSAIDPSERTDFEIEIEE